MEYLIGIDVGTSGVKALAVDHHGRILAARSKSYPLSAPKPGWAEQDPELWWRASCAVLKGLCADKALKNGRAAGVGISGQMHSSVFLDSQGAVIRPALLWCDGRTTAECNWITAKIGEKNLKNWVSNPALEGFTLPKILWLKNHEPAAFRRLAKVLMPKDFLRLRLSNSLATDYSDASGTLMLDVKRRRWSADVMKACGLGLSLLPELGESSEVLGRVSREASRLCGLPEGTPIVGGGADNACGAVGVGAVAPGSVVASWGTSGTVLAPTAAPKVDPKMRVHTFCSAVPGQWYVMGVMLCAGGAFAWYRDQLAGSEDPLSLNREAEAIAPGAAGLTFLPYLQGERTPHRDAKARGVLAGMTLSHSRAHVTRAVLEGICFGLRDSVEILRGLDLPLKNILLTGGGAKSPMLRAMQADIFGVGVSTVDKEEGPAFGAGLLAGVGVGVYKTVAEACASTLRISKPLRPDAKKHQAYAGPYYRYRSLYPALQPFFKDQA